MPRKDPEQRRLYNRQYRAAHRERLLAQDHAYYQAHREQRLAEQKARDARNKSGKSAYNKTYRTAHLARLLAYNHAYYRLHREAILEQKRQYLLRQRLLINAVKRLYYAHNRKKWSAYHAAHREASALRSARRRARKRAAAVNDFTIAQWRAMKAAYDFRCVYCGEKPAVLTQDHITPLCKGGSHTVANIVPACGPCNYRKHTGPPPVPVQPLLFTCV